MIRDKYRNLPVSMTTPESFDAFYTKKLDAFAAQLRDSVFDTVYVVGKEYACYSCGCRIFCRGQEGLLHGCLRCLPHRVRSRSDFDLRATLGYYPNLEECAKEWEAAKGKTFKPVSASKKGDVELGKHIKAARQSRGWSVEELASQVTSMKGKPLSRVAIQHYEDGWERPSEHVLGQLKDILGLEV